MTSKRIEDVINSIDEFKRVGPVVHDVILVDLLEHVETILRFALTHLVKDGRLSFRMYRVWLWPKIIKIIINIVKGLVRAFERNDIPARIASIKSLNEDIRLLTDEAPGYGSDTRST